MEQAAVQASTDIKKGLTGFQLKTIALILMVLDHIHYFFGFTGQIPEWFSMAGRLSAPLFLFCVVEGFRHTRNRKKYFFRIYGIAIAMGLIQYVMIVSRLRRGDGFYPQNQIFSNFVILLIILQGIDWCQRKHWLKGMAAVILPLAWPFILLLGVSLFPGLSPWIGLIHYSFLPMHTAIMDGGTSYILMGIFLYLLRNHRKWQAAAFFITSIIFNGVLVYLAIPGITAAELFTTYYEWMGAFAAILMLLYNGEKGKGSKHFFYWFYPVHVYVLLGISCILYAYWH